MKDNGIDPHEFKQDYVGTDISKYNIYKDKFDGQLWIIREDGTVGPIPTEVFLK